MLHFFQSESKWHPFRWFIIAATSCTLFMSYADYSGWRMMSFGSSGRVGPMGSGSGGSRGGYYGGSHYHK